jgi:hypothetical protein
MTFEINDVEKICFREVFFSSVEIYEDLLSLNNISSEEGNLTIPGVRYEKLLFSLFATSRAVQQIIHEEASIFYDNCLIEKGT